ncbi:hypothetical protein EHW66_19825 [Erwinia psidii]|uniref:hypothetical protein n=1 Tax=Erwinia psidii TaxID=69224 RepID=UPI00226B661C|nr:hypothetical protein [Erwinia psidii]MCX8967142.1 hypothetical protein [Erwinia psidii]
MYKLFITCRNVITGEKQSYQSLQGYKSAGKAMKAARKAVNDITCNGKYADDNEYTVTVGKVRYG